MLNDIVRRDFFAVCEREIIEKSEGTKMGEFKMPTNSRHYRRWNLTSEPLAQCPRGQGFTVSYLLQSRDLRMVLRK